MRRLVFKYLRFSNSVRLQYSFCSCGQGTLVFMIFRSCTRDAARDVTILWRPWVLGVCLKLTLAYDFLHLQHIGAFNGLPWWRVSDRSRKLVQIERCTITANVFFLKKHHPMLGFTRRAVVASKYTSNAYDQDKDIMMHRWRTDQRHKCQSSMTRSHEDQHVFPTICRMLNPTQSIPLPQ